MWLAMGCHRCFNPRSRVGSDQGVGFIAPQVGVSIRAPAWGATCRRLLPVLSARVSIRAPAWGATAPIDSVALR